MSPRLPAPGMVHVKTARELTSVKHDIPHSIQVEIHMGLGMEINR